MIVRKDSRLSRMLHVLLHMSYINSPLTSEQIAEMIGTNAVVVRRILSGLKKNGYVSSGKGHNGGWILSCDLAEISLYDVYLSVGQTELFTINAEIHNLDCWVEVSVNVALDKILKEAEQELIKKLKNLKLSELANIFAIEANQSLCSIG